MLPEITLTSVRSLPSRQAQVFGGLGISCTFCVAERSCSVWWRLPLRSMRRQSASVPLKMPLFSGPRMALIPEMPAAGDQVYLLEPMAS